MAISKTPAGFKITASGTGSGTANITTAPILLKSLHWVYTGATAGTHGCTVYANGLELLSFTSTAAQGQESFYFDDPIQVNTSGVYAYALDKGVLYVNTA